MSSQLDRLLEVLSVTFLIASEDLDRMREEIEEDMRRSDPMDDEYDPGWRDRS